MRTRTTNAARDGWLGSGSPAEHDCERVRRFAGEHATSIFPSLIRTEARDWADNHPSSAPAPPMLSDAVRHALCHGSATVTPVKGTAVVASPPVRGTLRGQP
jgi:hypothetical protein